MGDIHGVGDDNDFAWSLFDDFELIPSLLESTEQRPPSLSLPLINTDGGNLPRGDEVAELKDPVSISNRPPQSLTRLYVSPDTTSSSSSTSQSDEEISSARKKAKIADSTQTVPDPAKISAGKQQISGMGVKAAAIKRKSEGGRSYIYVDPVRMKIETHVQGIMQQHADALLEVIMTANKDAILQNKRKYGNHLIAQPTGIPALNLTNAEISAQVQRILLGPGIASSIPRTLPEEIRHLDPKTHDPLEYYRSVANAMNSGSVSDLEAAIRRVCAKNCVYRNMFLNWNNTPNGAASASSNAGASLFTDKVIIGVENIVEFHRGVMESCPDFEFVVENARYVHVDTGGGIGSGVSSGSPRNGLLGKDLQGIVSHFKFQCTKQIRFYSVLNSF